MPKEKEAPAVKGLPDLGKPRKKAAAPATPEQPTGVLQALHAGM